jgi:1-acyl-sn-glycerol-3-phosphate acyltransferase
VLRGLWVLFVVIGSTAVLASAAVVVELLRPGRNLSFKIGQIWSGVNLAAAGCRVRYEGHEDLDRYPPCVFVSNHQSNLDVWALARILPVTTRIVAKQSLFRIPIFGSALRAAGFIPVDRADRNKAIRSLGAGIEWLRAGNPLLMFAEGTRSRDGRLLPFKKGPFHLAVQAGCPVVPIAVVGSGALMRPGALKVLAGTIVVRFGGAVAPRPDDGGDVAALMERTRSEMVGLLERD